MSTFFYLSSKHIKEKSLWHSMIGEGHGTPLQYSCLEKSHGRRSLVGCSPWGHEELDRTERLHFHFSLSRIGEGNGNPLQCSCLENPRDGGSWWAAVYGATQSWTRLKRLSSWQTWRWAAWWFLCSCKHAHLKCSLMKTSKTYLAGFCPVLHIKKKGALCLIKPEFSLLHALW